ncbi:MAG: DNA gyrase subunit A, partial [Muribaculaceae bacterium]|nr:DNA gyrase subunit A [Muribaculaceae bacterium]
TELDAYRITTRGGKGVKTLTITDKTGSLVGFKAVNDGNDIVIINQSGITIRFHVADIRLMGRATQGVRIINLGKRNDVIASICCVDTDPEEEVEHIEEGEALPDMTEAALDAATDDNDIAEDDTDDSQNDNQ